MTMAVLRHPAEPRAPTLLVLLPGAYMTPAQFVEAGFLAAADRQGSLDLAIPSLDLAAITSPTALPALGQEILAPARASGYRQVWLGGISLGAFLALAYAADHGQDIDGLCLLAPYPGSRITSNEIIAAGGLSAWQPGEAQLADPEFRVWNWLKSPPAHLHIYCGYGRQDRFVKGMDMLAAALPEASVHTLPGGHDWPVWQDLWQHFLQGGWLPAPSPS